jgi:hypothetical protein
MYIRRTVVSNMPTILLVMINKGLDLLPNAELNPFLIHVVNIFRRNVIPLDCILQQVIKFINESWIQ